MKRSPHRWILARLVLTLAAALSIETLGAAPQQSTQPAEPKARPDLVRQPYGEADVEFMAGMIPHHAQAVVMAGWAPSRGARPDVRVLCERILGRHRVRAFASLRSRTKSAPTALTAESWPDGW